MEGAKAKKKKGNKVNFLHPSQSVYSSTTVFYFWQRKCGSGEVPALKDDPTGNI
jgi:hypothetical protein